VRGEKKGKEERPKGKNPEKTTNLLVYIVNPTLASPSTS